MGNIEIKQLPEITISGLDGEALLTSIKRLQAEAAALREALRAVEWSAAGFCLWCDSRQWRHESDCQRQLALTTDAGREILERLRRAEAERGTEKIDR